MPVKDQHGREGEDEKPVFQRLGDEKVEHRRLPDLVQQFGTLSHDALAAFDAGEDQDALAIERRDAHFRGTKRSALVCS